MSINKIVNLDLTTIDGNAFALMGAFRRAASNQGWANNEIKKVLTECQSGDYDNLVSTLMQYCR